VGKIIQVLGTPFTGFSLDIRRGSDINKALPKPAVIEIGSINCPVFMQEDTGQPPDKTSMDKLESIARSITPPRPSRNPFIVDGVCAAANSELPSAFFTNLGLYTERE
jgi:hypothetical protein